MIAVQVFGAVTLVIAWVIFAGVTVAARNPSMDVRWLIRLRYLGCVTAALTVVSLAVMELTWQEVSGLAVVFILFLGVVLAVAYGIVAASGYWPELRRYLSGLGLFRWLDGVWERVAWWRYRRWAARTDRKRPTRRRVEVKQLDAADRKGMR